MGSPLREESLTIRDHGKTETHQDMCSCSHARVRPRPEPNLYHRFSYRWPTSQPHRLAKRLLAERQAHDRDH